MFWDGYPNKGRCSGGGGHIAQGLNFTIPHDTIESAKDQSYWRFCDKCHGLFYNGSAAKGSCPASGGHNAAGGYAYILPHSR